MITALFWIAWMIAMSCFSAKRLSMSAAALWMAWALAMFSVAVAGTVLVNRP